VGLNFDRKTLNTKKVKRAKRPTEVLLVCLQHNCRKGNEGHRHRHPIDPARTVHNTVLRGSSELGVCAEVAASIFNELGIELDSSRTRVDAIVGIEYVFQPPPGWDVPAFYEECLAWVDQNVSHVVSAIVHRDQKRPHMHVIVLAVADGRLCGAELTSGQNHRDAQRVRFRAHVRAMLGLRPDREAKAPAKSTALVKLATSTGKGPRTHAAAAKSDAALERRAGASMTNLIAHQPHSPAAQPTDLIAPTSYCVSLSTVLLLFAEGVSAGRFSRAQVRPVTPAPRSQAAPRVVPQRDRPRSWVLPVSVAAQPAAMPQDTLAEVCGTATVRPWRTPPGLSDATPTGTAA